MVKRPKKVNGYPIIDSRVIPKQPMQREGWVICVAKCNAKAADNFVVACLFRDGEQIDREWTSGSYVKSLKEAADEFSRKCKIYKAMES